MIVYDPDSNWIKDILHFYKSTTLVKLTYRVIYIGLYMATSCYVFLNYFDIHDAVSPALFTWIGVALSVLLVFRTNTAYDRWWEGRKQWGSLVNHTRHLALILDAKLDKSDTTRRAYLARHISNYPFALSAYLRGYNPTEKLFGITSEEKKEFDKHYHIPNFISKKLIESINGIRKEGLLSDIDELQTNECLLAFSNITGACERIKNTPIPFSYNTYLKVFILIYTTVLPLAFVNVLGYYTIPLGMFEFFFLIGVEMMAEEIEDPFEDMSNDLPTLTLSEKIKNDVHEILEVYEYVEAPVKPKLYSILP
ncbi:MAG: bestrophin family protein [Cyclobacteriaceae bacterium]